MAQQVPEFERLTEWEEFAKQLVEFYPERFGHIDPSKLVAYIITNKEESDSSRPYEMQTDKLPMRLTNQYDYFIWFKQPSEWHDKPRNNKISLVIAAMERIDPEKPYSILPLDLRDQTSMVNTFGLNWYNNPNIPDALEKHIDFRD
ncbi:MAG: hypothetical protein WC755_02030 [Candidatus Woesearchaeota archaeon]|jgi:hypothetical protein